MHAIPLPEARTLRRPKRTATRAIGLRPEAFRTVLETELARHNRYLVPLGLLRIGMRTGVSEKLHEAVATEIRRTDSVCVLPDGSCALLLLHATEKQLRVVARRLKNVANNPGLVVALLPVEGRREEASLLWLSLCRAYEYARSS